MSEEAKHKVLAEALSWFREVLRLDGLRSHEKGLFEAVAVLRKELDGGRRVAPQPKALADLSAERIPPSAGVPGDIDALSSSSTIKDIPAFVGEQRYYDECTTYPVPADEYEEMIAEYNKKENPSD